MQEWMRRACITDMGMNLLDSGKHRDAIRYFNKVIRQKPRVAEFYFYRGRCYREWGLAIKEQNHTGFWTLVFKVVRYTRCFEKSNRDYAKSVRSSGRCFVDV